MSHRLAAIVMVTVLVAMLAIGCLAGLALHLELAAGPARDVFEVETYNRLFTAHGVVSLFGVLRPGLLATIAVFHVARVREVQGLAAGVGGILACVGAVVTALVAALVAVMVAYPFDHALVPASLRWVVRLTGVADLGLGLGVLIGMSGVERRKNPVLNWTVVTVASAQVLLGCVDLLVSDGQSIRAFLALQMAMVVGLGVVAASEPEPPPAPLRACVAVTTIALLGVYEAMVGSFAIAEPIWLSWVRTPIFAVGQLIAFGALARSLGRGRGSCNPAWDVATVVALVLVPALLVRVYIASLSVDVHLVDTYFAVGEVHLNALLGPALGGPLALRYFAPQRYAAAPPWLRRATPWLIGVALIWFVFTCLALGHQGMPRRYYAYLPEYLGGHRSAAVAAALLCLGMLVEAALWIHGRPRKTG